MCIQCTLVERHYLYFSALVHSVAYPLKIILTSPSSPPFPHSDGMSRTGVFITTMAEVERVKVQGEVDIFQTVKAARSERPHMVSTPVSNGAGGGRLWRVVGVGMVNRVLDPLNSLICFTQIIKLLK